MIVIFLYMGNSKRQCGVCCRIQRYNEIDVIHPLSSTVFVPLRQHYNNVSAFFLENAQPPKKLEYIRRTPTPPTTTIYIYIIYIYIYIRCQNYQFVNGYNNCNMTFKN